MSTILLPPMYIPILPRRMLIIAIQILILILNQNQHLMLQKVVDNAQNLSVYYSKGSSNVRYKRMTTFRTITIVPKVHPHTLKYILCPNNNPSNKMIRQILMMRLQPSSIHFYYNQMLNQHSPSLVQVHQSMKTLTSLSNKRTTQILMTLQLKAMLTVHLCMMNSMQYSNNSILGTKNIQNTNTNNSTIYHSNNNT